MADEQNEKENDSKESGGFDAKQARVRKIASYYYARKEIQDAIFNFSQNKEVVPRYYEGFGKRPDTLEYPTDVLNLALRGATSFHCSEEIWRNPLEIQTGFSSERLNEIRVGWDLLLDIDCKFIEYGKIAAWLLTEALYFHNVKNFGIKFSGSKGFHIGLAFNAFPKEAKGINIKDFFPEGPRLIAAYLKEMIKKPLKDRILEMSTLKEISDSTGIPLEKLAANGEFDPFTILEIDTILISSRHLYRMPYSLNEKTGLSSIVIKPEQIKDFHPGWAKPERVFPKSFLPKPEDNEAKELFLQALDWQKRQKKDFSEKDKNKNRDRVYEEIDVSEIKEENYPPCMKIILSGVKQDGRKRTLFVLINFLKSVGLNSDQIKEKVLDWNKKNYKPLKENYLLTQLEWSSKQAEKRLPPNCNLTQYYQDLGICQPDSLCAKIKNPINYFKFKSIIARRLAKKSQYKNYSSQKPYSGEKKTYQKKYYKKNYTKYDKDKIKNLDPGKKEVVEVPNYRQKSYVKY